MARSLALDRLPEAVVVVAPDGTIRDSNDRAEVLLGLTPAAVGRPLDEALDLRDDDDRRCMVATEVPAVGDRLPERLLDVVGPWGRRPVAVAGRWSEQGLVLTVRSADRRSAPADQADLVASLAHDLRSPLTSVKGFTRTLLRRWDAFDDEQKHTMLQAVDADADRVARLLRQLVEAGRLDAGQLRLRREPVDVGELVRTLADEASRWDVAGGRTVTVDAPAELPRVHADRDRLELALGNLVDNALRHAPGADVTVAVREVAGGVRVQVADTGPGLPTELGARAFGRLVRGADAGTSGAGLGLYVARGLVEAHGGTVGPDEDGAPGTRVEVFLPSDGTPGEVGG